MVNDDLVVSLQREPTDRLRGRVSGTEANCVYLAEKVVFADGKFVPYGQRSSAHHTVKTFDVKNLVASSHHQISLAKRLMAPRTLGAK